MSAAPLNKKLKNISDEEFSFLADSTYLTTGQCHCTEEQDCSSCTQVQLNISLPVLTLEQVKNVSISAQPIEMNEVKEKIVVKEVIEEKEITLKELHEEIKNLKVLLSFQHDSHVFEKQEEKQEKEKSLCYLLTNFKNESFNDINKKYEAQNDFTITAITRYIQALNIIKLPTAALKNLVSNILTINSIFGNITLPPEEKIQCFVCLGHAQNPVTYKEKVMCKDCKDLMGLKG